MPRIVSAGGEGAPASEAPPRDVPPAARPEAPGIDPGRPLSTATVTPDPELRGLSALWATPQLGWRSHALSDGADLGGARLSSPYPGLSVGMAWQLPPLVDGLGWGIGLSYGYAPLRLLSAPGATVQEWRAAEHRGRGELELSTPLAGWGRLGLSVGAAYEGLLAPDDGPLASVQHFSPRAGFSWSQELAGGVRLRLEGGVRPWASVGSAASEAYGGEASSIGYDAAVGLSGPLAGGGLRWTAGYDFLGYDSRFEGGPSPVRLDEGLHRVGIGVQWEGW